MKIKLLLASFALAATAALPAHSAEPTMEQAQELMEKLAERYRQIDSTAWPLLTAGADLCTIGTAWRTGVRPKVVDVEGDPVPTVFAVAAGSPADEAGVLSGDRVLSVNGSAPRRGFRSTLEENLAALFEGDTREPVELVVERGGQELAFTMTPTEACALSLNYVPGMEGRFHSEQTSDLFVTEAFFRVGDEEWQRLAFLAPDLAFAMSATRAKNERTRGLLRKGARFLDTVGVAGGGLLDTAAFGSHFVLNAEQALAADRVSMFLLARVGVDTEQVPGYWKSVYAQAEGDSALDKHFGLRPGLTEREAAFEQALAEIRQKIEDGEPLTPEQS